MRVASLTRRITSRYGSAGLTITMSAPSSTSSSDLAQRLVAVGGIHLVAAAVAEGGRRVGRLAERAVEGGGELGGVGEDRQVVEALVVERRADRADAPVHHVARRDHVGARARVRDGGAREQLERRVVVDRGRRSRRTPQWPWLVYSHRHTSVITSRSGCASLIARDRELHDALVVPRAGALLVLVGRDAEQHHGRDARARRPRRPRRPRARCESRSTPGIAAIGSRRSRPCVTNSGRIRSPASSRVSRTRSRSAPRAAQAAQAGLREGHRAFAGVSPS